MVAPFFFTALLIAVSLQLAAAEPLCTCDDFAPPGVDCLEQFQLGNCFSPGMVKGGFCQLTCDRCDLCWEMENQEVVRNCDCPDIAPPGGFTCEQQASWGKCSLAWMIDGGYCQGTCCTCPNSGQQDPKCACDDVQPPGDYTCDQQVAWGKCSEDWMIAGGYCRGSCCTCPVEVEPKPECDCEDVEPPGGHTCAEQVSWGKCSEEWMISGGFCQGSCCTCPIKPQPECDCEDIQPPGDYTCAQQASWGKCAEQWMIDGGFCAKTCDRCECPTPETESSIELDNLDFLTQNSGIDELFFEHMIEDTTDDFDSDVIRKFEIPTPPLVKHGIADAIVTHSHVEYYYPHQKEVQEQRVPIFIS